MEMGDFYKNKDVMVTGGCGSIGREIVKHLVDLNVKKVRVFDQNEYGHHKLMNELKGYGNVDYINGNIRDYDSLKAAIRGSDIAFHTAALKHLPLCEIDPIEAVKTNVLGTYNLIELAKEYDLDRVVFISTDKTVYPTSTMAATKLLCEKLVLNARTFNSDTIFSSVRFGNVLASDGSVIPLFIEQMKKNKEITLTDERMTRFFMSIKNAVDLVLKSAMESRGGEIFVLKMRSLMIKDLAESLIEEFAPKFNIRPEDVKIKTIGIRPSEKLYEQLMTEEEIPHAEDLGDRFVIRKNENPNFDNNIDKGFYISKYNSKLTKEEIKKMFIEIKIHEEFN